MAAFKEIKERINSIRTTRKITSAMKMVSAAKLVKAQRSITDMLPYSAALNDIFRKAAGTGGFDTAYTQVRPLKHIALVAFSSDSSLAGAFNSNVIRELRRTIDRYIDLGAENVYLYTIGKKVHEAAAKWECPIVRNFANLAAKPDYGTIAGLGMELVGRFERGEVDKVELIYHHFRSTGSQVLTHEDFLPLPPHAADDGGRKVPSDYIFEPSRREILEALLPKSFKLKLYSALLDSSASEHSARVIAMQTATENADKLVGELTIQYNKSRQQAITNELLDIMGGKN